MKKYKIAISIILSLLMLFTVSCTQNNPTQYSVNLFVNNSDYGTVTGGGTFDENTEHTIAAAAKEGYRFVNWVNLMNNNEVFCVSANYTFAVTGNLNLMAIFEIDEPDYYVTITNKPDILRYSDGLTVQLAATVMPLDKELEITWYSADEDVATVDENGMVSVRSVGLTRITAKAGLAEDSFELYIYGSLESVSITNKPETGKEFYENETIALNYTVMPVLTEEVNVVAKTSNPDVASITLSKSDKRINVVVGMVSGSAVISIEVDGQPDFSDAYIINACGERPIKQDFDKSNQLSTYTAAVGSADIVDNDLPDGSESAKALAFSNSAASQNPGVLFEFSKSDMVAGGLYRIALKLNCISVSPVDRILIRLYDSADPTREFAFTRTLTEGESLDIPNNPFSNRTFDRLFIGLDGEGVISFTVTDILISRMPLTGITIGGKPASAVDIRNLPDKKLMTENQTPILFIAPGGSDGRAIVWSSSNTAVATVNAATGIVTFVANSGTVTITATISGTSMMDTVIIDFYTSDPNVEILTQAGGWYALGTAPIQLSGNTKTGTKNWSSSNSTVAEVDTGEKLIFKNAGEAVITLSDGAGGTDSFRVGVYDSTVTRIISFGNISRPSDIFGTGNTDISWATENLHRNSVNLQGIRALREIATTNVGVRLVLPIEKGKTYTISVKVKINSYGGGGHMFTVRDGIVNNVYNNKQIALLNADGEYEFVWENYVGREAVSGQDPNEFWFYMRTPFGTDQVATTIDMVLTDFIVTRTSA